MKKKTKLFLKRFAVWTLLILMVVGLFATAIMVLFN